MLAKLFEKVQTQFTSRQQQYLVQYLGSNGCVIFFLGVKYYYQPIRLNLKHPMKANNGHTVFVVVVVSKYLY